MPYCPRCGYEYLPTVKECPECGVALVDEPPEDAEDTPIDEPLVAVYESPDEIMTIMVRELLEDAGISVVTQPGHSPNAFDGLDLSMHAFHSRLLVFESHVSEARDVIDAYLADIESGAAGERAVEEEEDTETE
jgi:hypothetical protein